jgi:hypothetical protein
MHSLPQPVSPLLLSSLSSLIIPFTSHSTGILLHALTVIMSTNGSEGSLGGVIYLPNPDPTWRDVRYHPIHSRGVESEDGLLKVDNYVNYFHQAGRCPAHCWPQNAADYGFQPCLPSQFNIVPRSGGDPHPVLNEDGNLVDSYDLAYPAFMYRQVLNSSQESRIWNHR